EQFEQSGRHLVEELPIQRKIASRDKRDDFFGEVRADAWNLLERLALEPHDGCGVIADGARGIAISAHAEEVLAANLEHVGNSFEDPCDLRVLHGGKSWLALPSNDPEFVIRAGRRSNRLAKPPQYAPVHDPQAEECGSRGN